MDTVSSSAPSDLISVLEAMEEENDEMGDKEVIHKENEQQKDVQVYLCFTS